MIGRVAGYITATLLPSCQGFPAKVDECWAPGFTITVHHNRTSTHIPAWLLNAHSDDITTIHVNQRQLSGICQWHADEYHNERCSGYAHTNKMKRQCVCQTRDDIVEMI